MIAEYIEIIAQSRYQLSRSLGSTHQSFRPTRTLQPPHPWDHPQCRYSWQHSTTRRCIRSHALVHHALHSDSISNILIVLDGHGHLFPPGLHRYGSAHDRHLDGSCKFGTRPGTHVDASTARFAVPLHLMIYP